MVQKPAAYDRGLFSALAEIDLLLVFLQRYINILTYHISPFQPIPGYGTILDEVSNGGIA